MSMLGLNLGSGQHPCPGDWVNVDLPWDGVDENYLMAYADCFALPFADDVFDRCYLGHFMEHIWWTDFENGKLDEVWRVLRPGAEVMVVGPCINRAVDESQPKSLLKAIIGAGDSGWLIDGPGAHKWIPTEALTARAMRMCGLVEVEPVDVQEVHRPEWPNTVTATWQCALRGYVS